MSENLFRNKGVLFGGFLALMTLSIMNSAYSNILDLIKKELFLTYTLSGALMSAYFLGYTIGQIPWGILADRYGSSIVISISVLGVSASTLAFSFSNNPVMALTTRFFAGLLGAGIFVPSVKLISNWFTSKIHGTALGILSIGGSIGLVIASSITPFLALNWGWRRSLIIFGALGVIISFIIKNMLGTPVQSSTSSYDYLDVPIKNKEFWILSFGQFIRLGSYYTFIAWLPFLLKEELGFSIAISAMAMSFFNVTGMAANPIGGIASDKLGERGILIISFLLLSIGILIFFQIPGTNLVFLSIFLLGWFINFVRSPIFSIIPKLFGSEKAGKVSGIHNTFASIGALSLPLMLGYIRDITESYRIGWIILAVLMVVNTIFLYFVDE